MAGFLADVKYGRYKTVFTSLCLITTSALVFQTTTGPLGLVALLKHNEIFFALFCVSGGIAGFLLYIGFVGFFANVASLESTSFMTLQEMTVLFSSTGLCGQFLPVSYHSPSGP